MVFVLPRNFVARARKPFLKVIRYFRSVVRLLVDLTITNLCKSVVSSYKDLKSAIREYYLTEKTRKLLFVDQFVDERCK